MKIDKNELIPQIREMKRNGFDYLVAITAVDYVKNIQALYFLRNISENKDEILEIELQPENPSLPTIIHLFKGANWYERELSEMFWIKIEGRNAKRLLLEKWDGKAAPLRKSFAWNAPYESSD